MNPMIALGQRMLYISCTSSIPPIWSEIYLRLSPARSLHYYFLSHRWLFINPVHVRLTHPCIHFPFVLSLTKYNSTEACAIYQVQSPFNPALSGHGQIAPPLLMLLFLACRHNWNKVLPPSTSDGWECCLLSMLPFKQNHCGLFFIQIAIYYLRYYTRQFFPTTVVVWAALVAFALNTLTPTVVVGRWLEIGPVICRSPSP